MIQKTITCIGVHSKRKEWTDYEFEDRQFTFRFSLVGSSIPGRPKDQHIVEVNIKGELLQCWRLTQCSNEELAKILLYYAAEHIRQKILEGVLQEREKITLTLENCPELRCPVEVSEIETIVGFSFNVDVSDKPVISTPIKPLSSQEVIDLISGGETATVEFKIGACRNPRTGKKDDKMAHNIVEAVAAFMKPLVLV